MNIIEAQISRNINFYVTVELQKKLREVIWMQEIEIEIMNNMIYNMPDRISDSSIKTNRIYTQTLSDFIEPNKLGLTNTYCDVCYAKLISGGNSHLIYIP